MPAVDFKVFSAKGLRAKLEDAGYEPPSIRTVSRWTSTGRAPGWAEVAVREALGITKSAPDVPGRLDEIERKLDQVLAVTSSLVESSAAPGPDLQAAMRLMIEHIEGTQPPGGAAPLESDPESDPVEPRPEDRGVE